MKVVLRVLVLLVAALLAAPPAVGAPVSVVAAQDCPPFDLTDADQLRAKLAGADAVFEGRVADVVRAQTGDGVNRYAHQVRVQTVYSGDLGRGEEVAVVTEGPGADGLGRLQDDARYLFFTQTQDDGTVAADACGGTTVLDERLQGAQVTLIQTLVAEAAQERAAVSLTVPPSGIEPTPSLTRLVVPGIAVAVLGLLGLFLVISIGARRPH